MRQTGSTEGNGSKVFIAEESKSRAVHVVSRSSHYWSRRGQTRLRELKAMETLGCLAGVCRRTLWA